jgi:hypothetical protein
MSCTMFNVLLNEHLNIVHTHIIFIPTIDYIRHHNSHSYGQAATKLMSK